MQMSTWTYVANSLQRRPDYKSELDRIQRSGRSSPSVATVPNVSLCRLAPPANDGFRPTTAAHDRPVPDISTSPLSHVPTRGPPLSARRSRNGPIACSNCGSYCREQIDDLRSRCGDRTAIAASIGDRHELRDRRGALGECASDHPPARMNEVVERGVDVLVTSSAGCPRG